MSTVLEDEGIVTLADLLARLGGVPLDRVRFRPAPGTAVERDVIELHDRENRLYELVDGVLVEKPMGYKESRIAALIIRLLDTFVEAADLGLVAGEQGMMRIGRGLVRIPDVSVVLWDRLPERRAPSDPIPSLAPDLAVEILSLTNTPGEIQRKTEEYFEAGCRCAWIVDPAERTVRVHTSASDSTLLSGDDLVTAESVLPGFSVSVEEIFRRSRID